MFLRNPFPPLEFLVTSSVNFGSHRAAQVADHYRLCLRDLLPQGFLPLLRNLRKVGDVLWDLNSLLRFAGFLLGIALCGVFAFFPQRGSFLQGFLVAYTMLGLYLLDEFSPIHFVISSLLNRQYNASGILDSTHQGYKEENGGRRLVQRSNEESSIDMD